MRSSFSGDEARTLIILASPSYILFLLDLSSLRWWWWKKLQSFLIYAGCADRIRVLVFLHICILVSQSWEFLNEQTSGIYNFATSFFWSWFFLFWLEINPEDRLENYLLFKKSVLTTTSDVLVSKFPLFMDSAEERLD